MPDARHSFAPSIQRQSSQPPRTGRWRRSAGLLAVAAACLVPVAAHSAVRSASREIEASRPHVYLMRGLLNIFSLGMDQMAAWLQGHGIDASVYNHSVEDSVVARIVQQYRGGDRGPFILIGHSLGADAVMTMAQQLDNAGVPVALVVPVDGTGSYAAPPNVGCVLNVTQRQYAYMRPGPAFHGVLRNVDVSSDTSIDHFTIDKSPRLQAMELKEVMETVHGEICRPGVTAPILARPRLMPAPKLAAPREPIRGASKQSANATKPLLRAIAKQRPAPVKGAAGNAAASTDAKSTSKGAAKSAAKSASPVLRAGYEG